MAGAGHGEHAGAAGDRLGGRRVEVGELVVTLLEGRLILEAQAQIDGQVAADFPIVLEIPVVAGLQERQRGSDGELAAIGRAEHGAGQAVTGSGARGARIGSLGIGPAEAEKPGRVIRAERIEGANEEVIAGLQRVRALEPGEVRLELGRGLGVDIVRSAVGTDGSEVGDVEAREDGIRGGGLQILRQAQRGDVEAHAQRRQCRDRLACNRRGTRRSGSAKTCACRSAAAV